MDDVRSERVLRQAITRAHQPNQWRVVPSQSQSQRANTAREQDFANQVDDLRFKHMGTSIQHGIGGSIRSRHTLQGIAGERA